MYILSLYISFISLSCEAIIIIIIFIGGSTKQELYDRKISWWFEDEKDLKDDLEWQEKKSELNESDRQSWYYFLHSYYLG